MFGEEKKLNTNALYPNLEKSKVCVQSISKEKNNTSLRLPVNFKL